MASLYAWLYKRHYLAGSVMVSREADFNGSTCSISNTSF